MDALLLAQSAIDPTAIGEKLGQAQDVQQVLSIIVGVLILVVLAVVAWYLRERKASSEEKADIIKRWAEAKASAASELATERLARQADSTEHQRVRYEDLASYAEEKEGLMREMMELSLRLEKVLDKLAERPSR